MGLCSCTAKLLVILFAAFFLALGVFVIVAGALSLSQAGTFLSGAVPTGSPWIIIGTGALLLTIGISGVSAACCSNRRKCSLCMMATLILLSFVTALAATVLTFSYSQILGAAISNGFADEADTAVGFMGGIQTGVYDGIKGAFDGAYNQCNGTGYYSTAVKAACQSYSLLEPSDADEVATCASSEYPTGYVGLYCKDGPGMGVTSSSNIDQFTIDAAMVFPSPNDTAYDDIAAFASFGALVNYACMPSTTNYGEYKSEVNTISMGYAANTTFGNCYSSTWWTAETPIEGGEMTVYPNTDVPLQNATATFFKVLGYTSTALSSKMVFCMCAAQGEESPLFVWLMAAGTYSKWISLGLSLFLLLTFIAACYLLCCKRQAVDDFLGGGVRQKDASGGLQIMMRP